MAKRADVINEESLSGLLRHHPYLQILQKEDWQGYLLLLSQIYDTLEEQSSRVPMDAIRTLALGFYSTRALAAPEQKVGVFFAMTIGELQVLKDSHDQFGQRYIEGTRAGKMLLQMVEGLLAQRTKFSGTGAETLLGSLNDILISRQQMSESEAINHHKERIEAYKDDLKRIKKDGISAAQLLPMPHSNEALFVQAEEAAIHVLQSIEEVKSAIELKRKELASTYFQTQRSAGQILGAVADFYQQLYSSPSYSSYVQAKALLSHLEGFQSRFGLRNVDRLLHTIRNKSILPEDTLKRSNLRSFMQQFGLADTSIQDKIRSQIRILQQQVLYSVSTDIEGLSKTLHDLFSHFSAQSSATLDFCETHPVTINISQEFEYGPAELHNFDLPKDVATQILEEESLDLAQQRELFLALLRAEEGTLKDILTRLHEHLFQHGSLQASLHNFPGGLAEYYVLSEVELFAPEVNKVELSFVDLALDSKHRRYVLRNTPDFVLTLREVSQDGEV